MARDGFLPIADPIITEQVVQLPLGRTFFDNLVKGITTKMPSGNYPRIIDLSEVILEQESRPGDPAIDVSVAGEYVNYATKLNKLRDFAAFREDYRYGGEAGHNAAKATWLRRAYLAKGEYEVKKMLTSDSNKVITLTTPWTDQTNSNPVDDIMTAIEQAAKDGLTPNTLALGYDAFLALVKHPKFLDLLKYTQPGIPGEADVAKAFHLENVVISDFMVKSGYLMSGIAVVANVPKTPGWGVPASFYKLEFEPFQVVIYREPATQYDGRYVEVRGDYGLIIYVPAYRTITGAV